MDAVDDFDMPFGTGEMSLLVLHDEVPPSGKTLRHEADADTLLKLAARLAVEEVDGLQFEALLTPIAGGCLLASGQVSGRVQQICGVTLEPLWTQIERSFAIEFQPAEMVAAAADVPEDDFDSEVAEAMNNGQADIGEAVTQIFAMEVPAYPRKADAQFSGYGQSEAEMEAEDKAASPFAALSALKGADGEET